MGRYSTPCDVGDVRYPFAIRLVRMKLPVEQVFVPVDPLPHLLPFPAAADFRQQIILLHDPKHSFRVTENILAFQP